VQPVNTSSLPSGYLADTTLSLRNDLGSVVAVRAHFPFVAQPVAALRLPLHLWICPKEKQNLVRDRPAT
jgi:hypothetical protein